MRVVFVGRHRPVWKRLVLYLLTLGISRRIWLYRIGKELDGHEALGIDHRTMATLLGLPVIGPSVVAYLRTRDAAMMLRGSDIPFGPPRAVYVATWIPILGNLFHIAWMQSRLNRFWAYEKEHPEHGVEVDLDMSADPVFRAEIGRALKESYHAGSRFDRRRRRRQEIARERAAVRAAGGSTPLWPYARPAPPARRILHITCGRCDTRFDVVRDPLEETPIVCPRCGLTDVLPSLRGDTTLAMERTVVPEVKVECPCGTVFHAPRNLHGETTLACPACGRTDVLEAPPEAVAKNPKPAKKGSRPRSPKSGAGP